MRPAAVVGFRAYVYREAILLGLYSRHKVDNLLCLLPLITASATHNPLCLPTTSYAHPQYLTPTLSAYSYNLQQLFYTSVGAYIALTDSVAVAPQ